VRKVYERTIVRESEFRRRRSRVPWIYLVYHVRERPKATEAEAREPSHSEGTEVNESLPMELRGLRGL
jgi:hypothetical protein